jgi:hypothetical protein
MTVRGSPPFLLGLYLAKPKYPARATLGDDPRWAGTHTNHSPVPFDHAFCPDGSACALGLTPPVRSQRRGMLLLRTLLRPGAPCGACRPAPRADCLPMYAFERSDVAGKPPVARVRSAMRPASVR